jgi:type IX secretion system PorP/SprF family membrane protein
MKKFLLISIILGAYFSFKAQQTPVLEHYLVNPYLINPATAGLNGNNVFVDIRNQWQSFVGAPQTQILTLDGAIKGDKMGIGLTLKNDRVNVLGSTSAYFSYNYNVKLSAAQRLRLGLSAGLNQNRILFENIIAEDPNEMQLFSSNQSATNFDFNAGIFYSFYDFSFGVAVNHIMPSSYYYENNFTANQLTFTDIRHFIINGQYNFKFKGGKWELQPSILAKGVQGLPFLFEGGVTTTYKKLVWFTARYIHQVGYTAALGGKITDNVTLAYAYGLSSERIMTQNNGSHEILLGYKFGKSSNSSSKLSDKDLKKIEEDNAKLNERIDFLNDENKKIKEDLEKQKQELKNGVFGIDELKKEWEKEREEMEKMIQNSQYNASNNNGNANSTNNNTVKNEDGTDKPSEGNFYVIIGATRNIENAKKYQGVISREYNLSTQVVRNSKDSWYLIYTKVSSDYKVSLEELARVKKLDTKGIYVGKPWIYKP